MTRTAIVCVSVFALVLSGALALAQYIQLPSATRGTQQSTFHDVFICPQNRSALCRNSALQAAPLNIYSLDELPAGFVVSTQMKGALEFGDVRLAPDNAKVAFVVAGHDDVLGVLDLRTRLATPITTLESGSFHLMGWSPDGRFVAFQATPASGLRQVRIADVSGHYVTEPIFAETQSTFDPELRLTARWKADDVLRVELERRSQRIRTLEYSVMSGRTDFIK